MGFVRDTPTTNIRLSLLFGQLTTFWGYVEKLPILRK